MQNPEFEVTSKYGKNGNFYRNIVRPDASEQNPIRIQFTKVKKFVPVDVKDLIMKDGGFKGGNMRCSANQSAILSWWSVYVDEEEFQNVKQSVSVVNIKEIHAFFDPSKPSIYGNNRFIYDLNHLIEEYERAINGPSEMRLFGSILYIREVMHTIVIAPKGHEKFADRELVDLKEGNCTLTKDDEDRYVWQCFSAIMWDNTTSQSKRQWAHLAFAFLLESENTILNVPAVQCGSNWRTLP